VNTTDGAREATPIRPHVVTTEIFDSMEYTDEGPDVVAVLPADRYAAEFEDGSLQPLLFWVVQEDGATYGVAFPSGDAEIDASESVSDVEGFVGYRKIDIKEDTHNG
jgi:hypothetical protein